MVRSDGTWSCEHCAQPALLPLSCSEWCVHAQPCRASHSATPWTLAHQAPLSMGLPRQGYQSGSPCPPPGDLPDPGMEPVSPALSGGSLPLSRLGSPPVLNILCAFLIWSPPHRPASHFPPREGDAQSLEHLRSCWDSSTWSSSLMGDWQTPKELSIHPAGPMPWSFYLSACPRC